MFYNMFLIFFWSPRRGGEATNALGIIIRDPQMQEMWEEKQDRANRIVAAV